jgi:hypothetical protein
MKASWCLVVLLCAQASAGVKTKVYVKTPGACAHTYLMERGRVLTRSGLVEDDKTNQYVGEALDRQLSQRGISKVGAKPDLVFRFMGGNSAGLQIDDPTAGDFMMWDIGGTFPESSRTYKKSTLYLAAIDGEKKTTIWSSVATDKFGDPKHVEERINKAIADSFKKFPSFLICH